MSIQKISSSKLEKMMRKSAYALPDNPSEAGMKPEQIKQHFYDATLGNSNSIMTEINRIVDEANTEISVLNSYANYQKTTSYVTLGGTLDGTRYKHTFSLSSMSISASNYYLCFVLPHSLKYLENGQEVSDQNYERLMNARPYLFGELNKTNKTITIYTEKQITEPTEFLIIVIRSHSRVASYYNDLVLCGTGKIPTKLSDLTNDYNYVRDSEYVHTDNNYTSTEKTKLSGIASGAQVNIIESIVVNGSALTPSNKTVSITTITQAQVETLIQTAIASLVGSSPQALDTLNELAQAINNDPDFYNTIVTALSAKANASDVETALASKANASDMTTALAGKASASDVSALQTQVGSITDLIDAINGEEV